MPGIKAFTAAVFGGIGSIPGAFLGGILLGIIEILGKAYISTQLSDAIVFAVLIIILSLIHISGNRGLARRNTCATALWDLYLRRHRHVFFRPVPVSRLQPESDRHGASYRQRDFGI